MELMDIMQNRRSIRKYTGEPVPAKKIEKVLEAGRLAPSARNEQEWKFVVVKGNILEQLTEACCNQAMVKEAGTAIAICATDEHMMKCGQNSATVDCSIAMSFMLLEAHVQGLGMCWLGSFYADKVKELLQLPEEWTVVAVSPLGIPDETPAPRPRKALEEVTLYIEK